MNFNEKSNKIIFVTVGQFKFDDLIRNIDELVRKKKIKDKVIMQIGTGTYKPKYCEYFTLKPSLDDYYSKADVIITHGGAGTLFNCLNLGKKVIAIPNYNVKGQHQKDLVNAFDKRGYIIYCRKFEDIPKDLQRIDEIKDYNPPECRIHQVIAEFLNNEKF